MPRPRKPRRLYELPKTDYFKPRGIPLRNLATIEITPEELMAMKLVDVDGYNQEKAAKAMNVSRKTLWVELMSARKKVADAIFNGKALEIDGGNFELKFRIFKCNECGNEWKAPFGTGRPKCPNCGSYNIIRIE